MASSKIKRLPPAIRDQIHRMLEDGATIDDVTRALHEVGAEVSRAGVGRFRKEWMDSMREVVEVRQFAEASIRALAEMPEDKKNRLNLELISSGLAHAVMALKAKYQDDPEKMLKLLCSAATTQMMLSKAARDDADKTIKAETYAEDKREAQIIDAGQATIQIAFVDTPKEADHD